MPWIDHWGRPRPHVGSGNGLAGRHPRRVVQFGIAGFRNPSSYRANLLEQARILPRAVRQVRSNKTARGRHEIARPLRRKRENSSAGSKASRTAQIVRLGRTGALQGYVHANALGAGRLLRSIRGSKAQHHLGRCGCCAAHTNMAHDMARSSWCPTGHLQTIRFCL